MLKLIFIMLFASLSTLAISQEQQEIVIDFQAILGESPIKNLPQQIPSENDKLGALSMLKFYVSNYIVIGRQCERLKLNSTPDLIDFEDGGKRSITIQIPVDFQLYKIQLDLGIDSLTNVSGAMSGDLDPSNNMYWTWQSGYINAKIEGTSPTCSTRKNKFQFHIGGYLENQLALRTITVDVHHKHVNVLCNLDVLLDYMMDQEICEIMSPNRASMEFADIFASSFKISER